jgi:hypothetical protein
MHPRLLFALLTLPLLLAGCGSFQVDADGVKGFSPSSQIWQIESSDAANRHSFVLTNIADYCDKKQAAEQDRIDADARHQERLDGGAVVCESEDERLDDLAAAYGRLERKGAGFLFVRIDREDETAIDAKTAPGAGEFRQVGAAIDGRFTAQYVRYEGKVSKGRAEAYDCLDTGDLDESNWQQFLTEEEPELLDSWNLDSGILTVEAAGDDSWQVDVEGDLLDGSSTIGSLEASLTAARCEVAVEAL